MAYLFKLELDRWRVHGRDLVGDLISNSKRLFLGLTLEIDKHRIRIPVHNSRAPFLRAIDDSDRLGARISVGTSGTAFVTAPPRTLSSVSRPLCTMLSAISTAGIRPE